ncbi:hypothetical protein M409DRAFT_69825 [Zasmidium cellare ATCC 36951]|uniref:DUF1640 domain-containing protein n=1 Tax=Zasmidium cellare ATCC 36951 TaxID=1080233 RepID=A0A6A6C399_ZASCE|nr:uncharacterized protein M409DRAFT_69825 [Zasmidium cellare ATCC 36951]KAF2161495.1 hypothetical protein M409DRAFT_69825 [Zasmidium cellare ATCC 36951]
MAAPRLPFLWPMLAKGFEAATPAVRSTKAAARMRAFHSCPPRRRPAEAAPRQTRYGTANQPPPHLGGGKGMPPPTRMDTPEQTKLPKIGEKLQRDGEAEIKAEQAEPEEKKSTEENIEPTTVEAKEASKIQTDPMLDAEDGRPEAKPPGSPDMPPDKPLESLLNTVPDPAQHSEEQQAQTQEAPEDAHPDVSFDEHTPPVKAPHINAPRHVHHFDTFGLVQRLMDSGWTESQAITIMKGMRVLLSDNMNMAQEALVNKSQVENETYLFRAACAELKTEVTARRKSEQEKMRTERTHLQHEVEILSQRLGQESGALKDELKGMFDDRKMAVRNEQREMESKIQRLNYQITVDLQADAKSEVEGLRWVMTRRVILALGLVIIMVIGSLKLYSNAVHEQELDAKRRANMRVAGTQTDSSSGNGFVGEAREPKVEGGESDVSYVSLG